MGFEKRALRPFDVMDKTQRVLATKLRIQSPRIPDGHEPKEGNQGLVPHGVEGGSIAAHGGTLLLNSSQFTSNTVGLYFGLNQGDWQEITREAGAELDLIFGKRADAPVSLLVTVTNTRLRINEVILDLPFEDWIANEETWRFNLVKAGNTPDRPRPFCMPQDGCTVTIQFVLNSELPLNLRVRGRAWRKGSWLAKWQIKISANRGSGLAPRPLTREVRHMHGIGDSCSSFIDFRGDPAGLCMVSDLAEVLTVYIDEELLITASEINAKGMAVRPASDGVLSRIVMDTYRSLVSALATDEELDSFDVDDADHRRTFTYHLLRRASEYAKISDAEALNILRESPNKFICLLEGNIKLLNSDKKLLELRGK